MNNINNNILALDFANNQNLIKRKEDESWLIDFLNHDDHDIAELLENPPCFDRLTEVVLACGPNLPIIPDKKVNLLIRLANDQHPKIQELALKLLDHPEVDINHQTKRGLTLLHVAAMNNNGKLIEALIAKGADLSIANENGETPFDVCWRMDSFQAMLNAIPFDTDIGGGRSLLI